MQVLAAVGDAPTAAIAVFAILIGVFLAARGPREKRAAAGTDDHGDASGPTLLKLPVAPAPEAEADVEPGFVGPQGEVVGHGRIRLGSVGPLGGREPAAAPPAPPPVEPEPAPEPEPMPAPEPTPEAQAARQTEPAPPEAERLPEPAPPAPAEAPRAEPGRPEASPAASEQALFTSPPTLPDPPAAPPDDAGAQPATAVEPPPAADVGADAAEEPTWRTAARAAKPAARFRPGTIKLGGKRADEPTDQE